MVMTRRAARAAAGASVGENDPVSESATGELTPSTAKPSADVLYGEEPSPHATAPVTRTEAYPDQDEISYEKQRNDSMKRAISWRLGIGHLVALVAVSTLAHAALLDDDRLELHAIVLLLCTIPLRTMLSLSAHSVREPVRRSGMYLALTAPVVFSSHALHVLATKASPSRLIRLIGCAAMDICANWLKMTVSAKAPTTDPFAILVSVIYSASDIFLAAVIAHHESVVKLFYPFLAIRFLFNTRVVVSCSLNIVGWDEEKKKAAFGAPR